MFVTVCHITVQHTDVLILSNMSSLDVTNRLVVVEQMPSVGNLDALIYIYMYAIMMVSQEVLFALAKLTVAAI